MIIIHDVVPIEQLPELVGQGIYEPISNEWLTSLCDFLWNRSLSKEVWVETVGNITRYIKERDAAEYQIISSSNQLIEIALTDNLIDEIYNYPLSAYIKVPGDWNYVRLQQGSFVDTLEVIEKGIDWVVLAKITPDKGLVSLTPVNPTTVEDEIVSVDKFELFQNYPNPFNPSTIISWQSPVSSWQTLKVYDVLGNEVATLVDEYKSAGMHNLEFTMHNQKLSSGLYFYQLKAGDYSETKKMMYLK
jgi:Secretion system C-terminal sorting domain